MPALSPSRSSHLTSQDVRLFLLDRGASDNAIDMDFSFSEGEIEEAMRNCARDYNSLPPYGVHSVDANCLPNDTTMFLLGTAKWVYLSALQKLMRNDMDFDVGGVTANIEKARIKHFTDMIQVFDSDFKEQARNFKRARNLVRAYGRVG